MRTFEHCTKQEGLCMQRMKPACEKDQNMHRSIPLHSEFETATTPPQHPLENLQRTLGNRAVQSFISRWLSPLPKDSVNSNRLSPRERLRALSPIPWMVQGYQRRFAPAPVLPGILLVQRDKIDHRTLTWDDFKGKVPKGASHEASTYSDLVDPDLNAAIPKSPTAIDTGEPCKRGKGTKFKADIAVDSSKIDVKSFFLQEKSWHKPWTTDNTARKKRCKEEFAPKCEKAFDKKFAKIKKVRDKSVGECEKHFATETEKAAKECNKLASDCKKAFKDGQSSFDVAIGGNTITSNTAKECMAVLLPECRKAMMQGLSFSMEVEGNSAEAANNKECKTVFGPDLEKLMKDAVTWEDTMSGASVTVSKRDECGKSFIDDCASTLMPAGSDALLKHEQAHFDLTDAMAQKAQSDLQSLIETFPKEVEACGKAAAVMKAKQTLAAELAKMKKNYAKNRTKLKNMQSKYDAESKHGTNEEKQAKWEERIGKGF